MEIDVIIDQRLAEIIQRESRQRGMLAIWVVYWNTKDYPDRAVVRPQCVDGDGIHILKQVLVGESLDAVRDQLPEGLTRMERHPDDELAIIEIWL